MSNNKIQTSDPSDITILDCSKVSNQPSIVSNTISQTGSLSDIAMPGCPNVSNKYQKVSESTSQMSDPNNIAKLDCSKVTKSKNKDQINKKMTEKMSIFEGNTVRKRLKFEPLKVNKIRSPIKVPLKCRPKSDKISQNPITNWRQSKLDLNLSNNIERVKSPGMKPNRLKSCKSPMESNTSTRKQISSSPRDRWHLGSKPNLNEFHKNSREIQIDSSQKTNDKGGTVSLKKSVKKSGQKQPK